MLHMIYFSSDSMFDSCLLTRHPQFESIVAELESLHKGIHVEAKVATQTSVSSTTLPLLPI